MHKTLIGIPVFNESTTLTAVYHQIRKVFCGDILFVDDGSTDQSSELIAGLPDAYLLRHSFNEGYGQSLFDIFDFASEREYEILITMDADGQHEVEYIQKFMSSMRNDPIDIISGSRYLDEFEKNNSAPRDRYAINLELSGIINRVTGYGLTDSFCGMKAYLPQSIRRLNLTEKGYAMPIEFWLEAYAKGLQVREMAMTRLYLDDNRSFGPELDERENRRQYYLRTYRQACRRLALCK